MKETKVGGCACVLVLLFSGIVTCSGVLGNPLTDDVATLKTLSENIPKDYKIAVRYISKDVGGACWLLLNLYPVENSLKMLAFKFGNLSSNRENITIFITMLQGLRFTIDSEELEEAMQVFQCHYRRGRWSTRRYFNHVKEVLIAFASMPHQFHCVPPPCDVTTSPPRTPGHGSQKHLIDRVIPGLLALFIIPGVATITLALRTVLCRRSRRHDTACQHHDPYAPETQGTPDLTRAATNSSSSENEQCRVSQDTLRSGDTAV
ncbi:kit ligand b [Brachyhypopomus gauderio]|uniref:kit ligand b n=1 Tax=Brachyhypopomus gauderio TaxID=698409 RepID=UPI00404309A8